MLQFDKIKLTGFKSFADPVELEIRTGLTGIVGPNGCGKSNLTEGLRWLMGETSAKSLRSGGMDDVIFAGTAKRPARQFSEVVLTTQNPTQMGPEAFKNAPQLEISRRIDRGMGSEYRLNSKQVRAADIQLLFADSAAGANSPSIVSQGRVADLVNAKPQDRRRVLEDAAAISGLHGRRKEAEQRLRAAEKNLLRVDDLLAQKQDLHDSLAKQAKQAARYRQLSDTILRLEAGLYWAEWQKIKANTTDAEASRQAAWARAETVKASLEQLQKERFLLNQTLEKTQSQWQELQSQIEQVQRKQEQTQAAQNQHQQQVDMVGGELARTTQDLTDEQHALQQAVERLTQLAGEKTTLESELAGLEQSLKDALANRDKALFAYQQEREKLDQAREALTRTRTQHQLLQQQQQQYVGQQQRAKTELEQTSQSLNNVAQQRASLGSLSTREEALQQAENALQQAQNALQQAENLVADKQQATNAAQNAKQAAQNDLTKLQAEAQSLEKLTQQATSAYSFEAVLTQLNVASGLETAVTTALGSTLRAGMGADAPAYWTTNGTQNLPSLPQGAQSLAEQVKGPDVLAAALQMVGIVPDVATGERLQNQLATGQMLVTNDGHGWRWDGFTVTPAAQKFYSEQDSATLLTWRNRLNELQGQLTAAHAVFDTAQNNWQAAQQAQQAAQSDVQQARQTVQQSQANSQQARTALTQLLQEQSRTEAQFQALSEKQQLLEKQLAGIDQHLTEVATNLVALPVLADAQSTTQSLETTTAEAEQALRSADQHLSTWQNKATQHQQRLNTIGQDQTLWAQRQTQSDSKIIQLTERQSQLQTRVTELAAAPQNWVATLAECTTNLQTLRQSQHDLDNTQRQQKQTGQQLELQVQSQQDQYMSSREELARAETQLTALNENLEQLQQRCQQQFNCELAQVTSQFDIDERWQEEQPSVLQQKRDRAFQERERLGAINLRAEEEAEIIGKEIETLTTEKADVVDAIEKLRQAISNLNRDARKKMLTAFEQVNTRFSTLFTQLFNGGEAHLQLVDADDPLEAGLEIFASPPGKKLQSLQLLSGGEQSLTAIALIFAMFLTTPAPICILDEIDAALDDANTERICNLLQDFSKRHQTRFLVITHNPITMAAMDRLYGVTMVEKGVSKLVSVDLAQAQEQMVLPLAAE